MKIIGVAWNYKEHNQEMGKKDLPTEPVFFMKPDSAILKNNKPFFLPDFSNEIHYETEIVIKINRLGKNISEKFAHKYYDEVAVGIDFTARDLQREQMNKAYPWEIAKSFDNSAVISNFVCMNEIADIHSLSFSLNINKKQVQKGNTQDLIFNINQIIAHASKYFTLKIGDLIFTGTPSGVGEVSIDDHLEAYIEDKKLLDFYVK